LHSKNTSIDSILRLIARHTGDTPGLDSSSATTCRDTSVTTKEYLSMPVYWDINNNNLPLPDWVLATATDGYDTRMAQMMLLLRPAGLARLRIMLAQTSDQTLLVPGEFGWRPMRISSGLDVLPKPGGWLRVCFDVEFIDTPSWLSAQDACLPCPLTLADEWLPQHSS
jgi:hypothetical protein